MLVFISWVGQKIKINILIIFNSYKSHNEWISLLKLYN